MGRLEFSGLLLYNQFLVVSIDSFRESNESKQNRLTLHATPNSKKHRRPILPASSILFACIAS